MSENIDPFVKIFTRIASISEVIKNLAIRFAQDVGADKYMQSQFIYALKGGVARTTELDVEAVNPYQREKIELSNTNLGLIKKDLSKEYLPEETHLSVISATEIGCHHPEVILSEDLSAIALHSNVGLCSSCTHLFKFDLPSGIVNPYRCWRRGHKSGRFGFIFKFSIEQSKSGDSLNWKISNRGRTIASSNLVNASLRYYISRNTSRDGRTFLQYEKLSERLASMMMIAIKVRKGVIIETTEQDQIETILPPQNLFSSHIEINKKTTAVNDYTRLPVFISDLIRGINGKWINNRMSYQSEGILSLHIIHNGNEELVNKVESKIRDANIVDKSNFKVSSSKDIDDSILSHIDESLINSEGVVICLLLDPIMDLGVMT